MRRSLLLKSKTDLEQMLQSIIDTDAILSVSQCSCRTIIKSFLARRSISARIYIVGWYGWGALRAAAADARKVGLSASSLCSGNDAVCQAIRR